MDQSGDKALKPYHRELVMHDHMRVHHAQYSCAQLQNLLRQRHMVRTSEDGNMAIWQEELIWDDTPGIMLC